MAFKRRFFRHNMEIDMTSKCFCSTWTGILRRIRIGIFHSENQCLWLNMQSMSLNSFDSKAVNALDLSRIN